MNVLVVMLDSLRADYLGCAGHAQVRTPHLDRVAAEGLVFRRAYAEYPITIPARTALVSGCYTWTNRPWCPLRPNDMHIAEVLREHGYATAAFSDTPFNAGSGMDRGFEVFEYFDEGKCHRHHEDIEVDASDAYFPPDIAEAERRYYLNTLKGRALAQQRHGKQCPELLFDRALEWLGANDRRPFLLWIDSFEPHEPWAPVSPYRDMYGADDHGRYIPMPAGPGLDWAAPGDLEHILALYMGDVTHTDEMIGRVTTALEELGLAEDTLLVIISDHGEPFGEHGTIRKFNVPVYEELARMVWIMRKPGLIAGGLSTAALAQNTDFAPTILELCGIEPPPRKPVGGPSSISAGRPLDGVSLVPLLRGADPPVRDCVFNGAFGLRASIRTERHKFIDNQGERENELYDLEQDPAEQDNVIGRHRQLAEELHRRLWEFRAEWASALSWRDRPAEG
jgi:arylsulfatase A-like enzyme